MATYTLQIRDYVPSWTPGTPIDGQRVTAALAKRGVAVTLCDPDGQTGIVTIEADRDPAAALAGVTVGPTDAETSRAGAVAAYKVAIMTVRGATTGADLMAAVKQWELATTAILRLIDSELT